MKMKQFILCSDNVLLDGYFTSPYYLSGDICTAKKIDIDVSCLPLTFNVNYI